MRATVTGGAGFIGSQVSDAQLARGDEVHIVDDLSSGRREDVADGVALHELDIRDEALEEVAAQPQPEVVFCLAARSAGARIVFASTAKRSTASASVPREEEARRPMSPYTTSKAAGEDYLAMWSRL